MSLKEIARSTFTAGLISEGSWGSREVGTHQSTMILYKTEDRKETEHYFIEWDIPSLETSEEIGLIFDNKKRLIDYDGIFSLPREAVALIRKAGLTVPRDME